jgi:AcrR family transcriptional regulator
MVAGMPRVSEAHLTARRQQILHAAWRCFARNGFHATSMQDIFTEAGLSAGAVYRYFPSKLDLIKVTAESVMGGFDDAYESFAATDPVPTPDQTFQIVVHIILGVIEQEDVDVSRIAVHVWSEALRDSEIGELVRDVGLRIRQRWVDIAARWRDAGHIASDADLDDIARLCYGVMAGFVLQRNLVGDVTPEQYMSGLTALIRGDSVAKVPGGDADAA